MFRRCLTWALPTLSRCCGCYFVLALLSVATISYGKEGAGEKSLNLFIWGEYMAPEVLAAFKAKTGIVVKEANYSSNEELLAKIQAGAKGYDVVVPSDYMVEVMSKMGLLASLDKKKLSAFAHIEPQFLGKAYDPQNNYAVPYSWSMTGIAVNRRLYKGAVNSWMNLLDNPAAKGRVSVLDDVRETMGAALKALGKSYNSSSASDLQAAKGLWLKAKPHIKAFNNTPGELLKSGDVVLAQMYVQEALLASRQAKAQDIIFVVPKEGTTLAIDNLVILKNAPHPEAAYAFINFLMEPNTQKLLVSRVYNGPVVKGLKAMLPKDLQTSSILFPAADVFARSEMIHDVGESQELYDRLWAEIKLAK